MNQPSSDILDYVNQLPGHVCIKDVNSVYMACSPSFTNLLGYDKSEHIQSTTDFDIRCGAVLGADAFVYQDQYTLKHGKHNSINIYNYASGQKYVLYCQKSQFIVDGKVQGVNVIVHDLIHLNQLSTHFHSLLATDGNYLNVSEKQSFTYNVHDGYPDFNLTRKESLCLFFLIRGHTYKEIGVKLHLSERTIEDKVYNIKIKMGCSSKHQIIENTINRGYLNIFLTDLLKLNNFSLSL